MISGQCPHCGADFQIDDKTTGEGIKCPACGQTCPAPGGKSPQEPERSRAGNPILRHAPRTSDFQLATGDEQSIELISEHIETHLGKITNVLHELISDLVHLDVYHVGPTKERPYHTLITGGMSDLPMTVPEEAPSARYAELLIKLPASWPLSQEECKDERNYWPVRWLKMLGRLPHEYNTWLSWGHTVPNGDPPRPFAFGIGFCCLMLIAPLAVPDGFHELKVNDEKTVHFYGLIPLYREEMDYKLNHGADALLKRLGTQGVSDVIDVRRVNVGTKRGR
jgi:hypothetical protein